MHQAYCRDTASSSALRADYEKREDRNTLEAMQSIHANRLLAFLSTKFRVGGLDMPALRMQAERVMQLPSMYAYWTNHGSFRWQEGQDSIDLKFNQVMEDAYASSVLADTDHHEPATTAAE
ncbi:DUF6082 family protein [Streptomyces naphthomycinicus]|uniref:DUF6082 family protein n=1 Tax=Streptomyces naphthomycinicus TaxID=2872625 RepID=UPI001CEDC040|nr:DUF6082 family protein [Streptomyces sp. TML10]